MFSSLVHGSVSYGFLSWFAVPAESRDFVTGVATGAVLWAARQGRHSSLDFCPCFGFCDGTNSRLLSGAWSEL